jgi:hypothetical protein
MKPSTVITIGQARVVCESCGYAKIYPAPAGDPAALIVGEDHVALVQPAELIG